MYSLLINFRDFYNKFSYELGIETYEVNLISGELQGGDGWGGNCGRQVEYTNGDVFVPGPRGGHVKIISNRIWPSISLALDSTSVNGKCFIYKFGDPFSRQ